MNCFAHPLTPATGTCQNCGRGLCSPCTSRFTLMRCEPCLVQGNKVVARKSYTALVFSGLLLFVPLVMFCVPPSTHGPTPSLNMCLLTGVYLVLVYWAYKFISLHMPRLVWASLIIWWAYFALKFTLALFFGIILGPIELFKAIRQLWIVHRTKGQLARREI